MTEDNFQGRPNEKGLRLFLVRHGETDANRNHLLQGISDGPLNALGVIQVEQLSVYLKNIVLDRIYSSDLQRAVNTAKAIAGMHGLKVEVDPQLREWNVGDLDGMPAEMYLRMIKDSGKPLSQFIPPGGTMLGEVRGRAEAFLERLIAENIGKSILLCSHGDFMRMMIGSMLKIDSDAATAFYFNNASYSVLEYTDGYWKVIALNRLAANCG